MAFLSNVKYFEPLGSSFARFPSLSGLTIKTGFIIPGSGISDEIPPHKRIPERIITFVRRNPRIILQIGGNDIYDAQHQHRLSENFHSVCTQLRKFYYELFKVAASLDKEVIVVGLLPRGFGHRNPVNNHSWHQVQAEDRKIYRRFGEWRKAFLNATGRHARVWYLSIGHFFNERQFFTTSYHLTPKGLEVYKMVVKEAYRICNSRRF
jgi:hypothetical protein